jgi:glucokinase
MPVLAIDLGGTKLAIAVFSEEGVILCEERIALENRKGSEVGVLIAAQTKKFLHEQTEYAITSIGVSVPGISYQKKGTVWAPNIPGWEDYLLLNEIKGVAQTIPVTIDSDRACYILGEVWKGVAKGCTDAIFLAIGTGIGAGILVNGTVLRGANDIAGAIGWMALDKPYQQKFVQCGCFESRASGDGIAKLAKEVLSESKDYNGILKNKPLAEITAHHIFQAHEENDVVAQEVIRQCIELWGMAIANLVSLFNPQKIILGGGVFGPAIKFIPAIYDEATKWAQPVSMKQVSIEPSALGNCAGLYGAGWLALQNKKVPDTHV